MSKYKYTIKIHLVKDFEELQNQLELLQKEKANGDAMSDSDSVSFLNGGFPNH